MTTTTTERADALAERAGIAPRYARECHARAYRSGSGVPYQAYGPAFRHGQGHINRPAFTHHLTREWLAAVPEVIARLESAPHPRVADVGCGQGWSTIAMAAAFLDAWVDGIDLDAASIADARRHAADAGLDGRVRFRHADATDLGEHGPYELILILDALHDMARPADALRAARGALADGGTVLVVDENVADRFIAPGDEVTVRELATQAGYARVEVLALDNDFFRLYRLHP